MSINYKSQLNPVWHMMLYRCTHTTTVGVKGLTLWLMLGCTLHTGSL